MLVEAFLKIAHTVVVMEIRFQNEIKRELEGNTQRLIETMALLEDVCADVNASLLKSRLDLNEETKQGIRSMNAYKLGACSIENKVDLGWGLMVTVIRAPTNELVERYISIYGKPVKVL